jgi:hypothetical protein
MIARSACRGVSEMPAQKQKLGKNYIGIVSDKTEEQSAIESLAKSDHLLKDYFLGLMAAVLNRHGEGR